MSQVDDAIKRLLAATGNLPSPLRKNKKPDGTFLVKGNMRDERTFSQLANDCFSGIRANDMWLRFEIWVLGRLDGTLSYSEFFRDPESLNRLYTDTFGIDITFTAGALHDIQKLKERKLLLDDRDIQKALQARDNEVNKKKEGKKMRPIVFEEVTNVIAEDQPPYIPFPVYTADSNDYKLGDNYDQGRITACWRLTLIERIKVLFSGVIWHQILTFNKPLQPQLLQVDKPAMAHKWRI